MTQTCHHCKRPTGGDYRIVAFELGADGIPQNLALCRDCLARGVVLGTDPPVGQVGELPPAQPAQLGMWGAP